MAAPKTVATYDLGSATEFDFSFDYLTRAFVQVSVIGTTRQVLTAGTDYRFVSNTRIALLSNFGPPEWAQIEIRRVTSTQDRLVDFQDASILRADDLNLSDLQVLHVAEEAREAATETIGTNNEGNLDARGRRIVNVIDPVDPLDVVNRRWYEADVAGTYQNRVAAEQARDKAQEWATKTGSAVSGSEFSAKYHAGAAAGSATAAASSATTANTHKGAAANSATAAANSATAAANSATDAAGSATTANTHRGAAANSATAAANSATDAANSATDAAGSATAAAAHAASVDPAALRNRANHTGTQAMSTIIGLVETPRVTSSGISGDHSWRAWSDNYVEVAGLVTLPAQALYTQNVITVDLAAIGAPLGTALRAVMATVSPVQAYGSGNQSAIWQIMGNGVYLVPPHTGRSYLGIESYSYNHAVANPVVFCYRLTYYYS